MEPDLSTPSDIAYCDPKSSGYWVVSAPLVLALKVLGSFDSSIAE